MKVCMVSLTKTKTAPLLSLPCKYTNDLQDGQCYLTCSALCVCIAIPFSFAYNCSCNGLFYCFEICLCATRAVNREKITRRISTNTHALCWKTTTKLRKQRSQKTLPKNRPTNLLPALTHFQVDRMTRTKHRTRQFQHVGFHTFAKCG